MLHLMVTDCWSPQWLKNVPFKNRLLRSLSNRNNSLIPADKIAHFSGAAVAREAWLRFRRKCYPQANLFEDYNTYGIWFAKAVAQLISNRKLDEAAHMFHGFTTGALETMELLRSRGVACILQQIDTGRSHYQMLSAEAKLWPGWHPEGMSPPAAYFARIDKEWDKASVVIVNSKWTWEALSKQGVPIEKMAVVPLTYDAPPGLRPATRAWKAPLQVLWVADVVLGKGIQYFMGAARRLAKRNISFVVAGTIGISREAIAGAPANMKFLGRVPRGEIGRYYSESHVYVFPTLSDGFGLTQLEAMAHGLPVIATPNCGEVVSNGIDGWIVPARDETALVEAIAKLDDDRQLLRQMSEMTGEKVAKFKTSGYATRMTGAVLEIINGKAANGDK